MDDLKPLGLQMTDDVALGGSEGIDGYGKAALSAKAASWSIPRCGMFRAAIRCASGLARRRPSSLGDEVGGPGTPIDIPLGHINAAYVRSHFDAMEVRIPDAPRAGEILFALAMSRGPRIHNRMGGLTTDQVKGEDGLR